MEFITISTLGNGADFGDFIFNKVVLVEHQRSNAVRGIFAGGYKSPATSYNNISYITIATLGDSKDFGDLTYSSGELAGCASPTRIAYGAEDYLPEMEEQMMFNISKLCLLVMQLILEI